MTVLFLATSMPSTIESFGPLTSPQVNSQSFTFMKLSEAEIQKQIRLEAANKGIYLWRNNVGATYTKDGAFIRYGLANDSTALNREIKSADLIGVKPILITPEMVGVTIGQFISREVKLTNWRYSNNDQEKAQLKWAELILSLGGDASFATGLGSL